MASFPKLISTNPTGEDLFEGMSQEKLCDAIANHIVSVDKGECDINIPRVIGIEGSWGSGKSNVLRRLENNNLKDNDGYIFFSYDAWANQEDLQRRSILELLTSDLLYGHEKPLLQGTTIIKVQKINEDIKEGYITVEEEVDWKKKLDMLMAKRVKSISKTVSPLNIEFKLLMLALALTPVLSSIMNLLKNDMFNQCCFFAISLIVVLLPALIFLFVIRFHKNYSFRNAFQAFQSKDEDKTTHQIINEAEPTIREFTTWMDEISKGIGDRKLIVVFDNMDRLPSEKVKQLWSSIHSLFSTNNYNNIWCIIPYDFSHLMSAFGNDEQITKYFIQKSFPVTYRVPEPAIIDYKILFDKFIVQAFGDTIANDEKNLINTLYRSVFPKPNVRELINFINRMVMLKRQWNSQLDIIPIAIYLLREDTMLRHPFTEVLEDNTLKKVSISTDQYVLGDELLSGMSLDNYDRQSIVNQVAALVYGISPDDAYQVVMQNALHDCFVSGKSIDEYAEKHHFCDCLHEVASSYLPTAGEVCKVVDSITTSKLDERQTKLINDLWHTYTDKCLRNVITVENWPKIDEYLFKHVESERQIQLLRHYAAGIINDEKVDGKVLFSELQKMFGHDCVKQSQLKDLVSNLKVSSKRYCDFVETAAEKYSEYSLETANSELNKYLISNLSKSFAYMNVVRMLATDKHFDLTLFFSEVKKSINTNQLDAFELHALIQILRQTSQRFDCSLDQNHVMNLWNNRQSYSDKQVIAELFAIITNLYPHQPIQEPSLHGRNLAEMSLFYKSTEAQFENFYSNISNQALISLVSSIVKDGIHDGKPTNESLSRYFSVLPSYIPGDNKIAIIKFLDNWGIKALPQVDVEMPITQFIQSVEWFDALLKGNTPLCEAILSKAAAEMSRQGRDQFYDGNLNRTNNYWNNLLDRIVKTQFLKVPFAKVLHEIAVDVIELRARNVNITDPTLLSLADRMTFDEFNSKLREVSKKILNHENGYSITPSNFLFFHKWLERLEINKQDVLGDSADYILAPVIMDEASQRIILENKEFYKPIIADTQNTSNALHGKIKELFNSEGEFAAYLRELLTN